MRLWPFLSNDRQQKCFFCVKTCKDVPKQQRKHNDNCGKITLLRNKANIHNVYQHMYGLAEYRDLLFIFFLMKVGRSWRYCNTRQTRDGGGASS